MTPTILFYTIIGIICIFFLIEKVLDSLNASKFNSKLPEELSNIFDEEEYTKSQKYKSTNYKFGLISSSFSFLLTICFLNFNGFDLVDQLALTFSSNPIIRALIFFGVIMLGSMIIGLPFSYYKTFVIEEKFGFNKSSLKTFILDQVKGILLGALIGGPILALIIWFYLKTTSNFWIYTWVLVSVFSVFMNMFYSKLIVPIFNKQKSLEEGSLKTKISNYAKEVGFKLDNVFVINGSKRSSKANAYFSGFGKEKRITLYDTLINDLEEDEIVAVLAHEVGHYKRKHIVFNLSASILLTGLTLYILSLFISNPNLSLAIGVSQPSFHAGIIAFSLLYTPINEITSLIMNVFSRRFEYEADDYAKQTFNGNELVNALKKLTKNSLSNLTPHKAYVYYHYSHPTLLERIKNING